MSCPVCDNIIVTETDSYCTGDGVMYITYECDKCRSVWDEAWVFVGIEHLEEMEERR